VRLLPPAGTSFRAVPSRGRPRCVAEAAAQRAYAHRCQLWLAFTLLVTLLAMVIDEAVS
jgi:hypothetical protein